MVPIAWFFAGVLATGVVGGVVTILARDLAIPWLLDKTRANRDKGADLEREERAHAREDGPIRERIIQKVRNLLRAFQQVFVRGSFSLEEWQYWHDQIYQVVDSDSGARALGELYRDMMDALNYDQLAIAVQAEREKIVTTSSSEMSSRLLAHLKRQHDAYLTKNVGTVALRFTPILAALGEGRADEEFGDMAREAVVIADLTTTEVPPLD